MKSVVLLSHAKTSKKDAAVSDDMRPLSVSGKNEVYKIGKFIKNTKLFPSLIISSTAKRAKDTSDILAESICYKKEIQLSELLYETIPKNYIDVISKISNDVNIVLLVRRNPILENLIELIKNELIIMENCSLVHIILPITNWMKIKTNPKGRLIKLVTIKELI